MRCPSKGDGDAFGDSAAGVLKSGLILNQCWQLSAKGTAGPERGGRPGRDCARAARAEWPRGSCGDGADRQARGGQRGLRNLKIHWEGTLAQFELV